MIHFTALFDALEQTTETDAKVAALAAYLADAPEADRLWAIALLSGRRPKRSATTSELRDWAREASGLPHWLFEECYPVVGDVAETIALILPEPRATSGQSLSDHITAMSAWRHLPDGDRRDRIIETWGALPSGARFVFNKLVTGGFRLSVNQSLVTRALSRATGVDEAALAHRLAGDWTPESVTFEALILAPDPEDEVSKPYPLHSACAFDGDLAGLGDPEDWAAEHKWDGMRSQVILRGGQHFVWSRDGELMTDRFPELAVLADYLPWGTVLDGELLAWDHEAEAPQTFNTLQKRFGRKKVTKSLLNEAPVILKAFDLLEDRGEDIRDLNLHARRERLAGLVSALSRDLPVRMSPLLAFEEWKDLDQHRSAARGIGAEGVVLKRKDGVYRGDQGDWKTWKIDPLTIDGVMIYAEAGRRAQTFTFAVWNGDDLVPFTKASAGLTDAETAEIAAWVQKNTRERFGPVRSVEPWHVFEIAFEGIEASSRHKSGLALKSPRIKRWRRGSDASDANTLDDLKSLLAHRD